MVTQTEIIRAIENEFPDCIAEFDSYGERLYVEYIDDEMPDWLYDEIDFYVRDLFVGGVLESHEEMGGNGIVFDLAMDNLPK